MAKMRLSSVTIKGMHNVKDKTYQLKNFNYLHGPNGIGKTTVMQAIQLALLGYIPGTDKRKDAIFKHAGNHEMKVTLNIEDGSVGIQITRTWSQSSKDIISHVMVTPESYNIDGIMQGLELPVMNFNEFIGMTSNKLKDWFMWFLPAANDTIDWTKTLHGAISEYGHILNPDYVTEIVEFAKGVPAGLEGIRTLNEHLKGQLSFKKGEASRVQSTIQSLVYYEDCDTALDSNALSQANKDAGLTKDGLKAQLLLVTQNQQVEVAIRNLNLPASSLEEDTRYIEAQAQVGPLGTKFSELHEGIQPLRDQFPGFDSKIQALKIRRAELVAGRREKDSVITSGGVCPYTKTQCGEIVNLIDKLREELSALDADVQTVDDEIAAITKQKSALSGRIAEQENASTAAKQEFVKVSEVINNLTAYYNKLTDLQSRLHRDIQVDEAAIKVQISEIEATVSKNQDLIVKIEANKKYTELTDTLTKQKYEIEQAMEMLKDWIKLTDVNGLQSRVMDKPFETLGDKMTEYLRKFFKDDTMAAKFHLSEKANSFSFGVTKNTGLFSYIPFNLMSSGEQCLYTLSLLLSIVNSDDIQLPLVLVDDLLDHLDKEKTDALFEALYTIDDVQIILAGVQDCRHPNANEFVIEVVG